MKMCLIPNIYYILISNNKENLCIAQYLRKEQVGKFEFDVFKDIVSEKELYPMCAKIAFTEQRF